MLKITSTLILALIFFTSGNLLAIEHKERSLGPTGLYGITSPTSIKVTKVSEGSPAAGKIKVGDVLIGAGNTPFKDATRKQFADAVDQAESFKGGGDLKLVLKGNKTVSLKLPVLGDYSKTAPYNCKKTDAIITKTADYVTKNKNYGRGGMTIGLLGLLATGEDKYIKVVRDHLHSSAWTKPDFKLTETKAWYLSYTGILLCEYYLLTKDAYILPAIKNYAVHSAMGRDAGGLWGHTTATDGRLPGYAQMNCTSAPMFLFLELSVKCGVDHPEVKACLAQNKEFYQGFVGRGSIPYGVHGPNTQYFADNGKGAILAHAFAVNGNTEGAEFFSISATASHNQLETGHTGHYFNQMWTGLAADISGPQATAAFFKETRWLHTMNRTWDGGYTYDCSAYKKAIFSYRGLSDEGSHLLNYCRGRSKIYITGKNANQSLWLSEKGVAEAMKLPNYGMDKKSAKELLALFSHPMPQIRRQAIWALRPMKHDLTKDIRKLVRTGSPIECLSACGYFAYGCPPELSAPSLEDISKVLQNDKVDTEVRGIAASVFAHCGPVGKKYFNTILSEILKDKPNDPLGYLDERLGVNLNHMTKDPFADKLITDKKLFYAAADKLLKHKRHSGRTQGAMLIKKLPVEDFHLVADSSLAIIKDEDRTFHSYHGLGPQTNIIGMFANLKIEGGIEAAYKILEAPGGKFGFKIRLLMSVIPKYGANAKYALPKISKTNAGKFQGRWDAMVKEIETSSGKQKMRTFEEAKAAGK